MAMLATGLQRVNGCIWNAAVVSHHTLLQCWLSLRALPLPRLRHCKDEVDHESEVFPEFVSWGEQAGTHAITSPTAA